MCLPNNNRRVTAVSPIEISAVNCSKKISHVRSRPSSHHHHSHHAHIVVQHNYHDHANVQRPLNANVELRHDFHGRTLASVPFPIKLHELLSRMEQDGHAHIMSWQPHGRCFIIRKNAEFKELLPYYFPSVSKLASFQRQLNLYGFLRITQGADKCAYYNEYFLRNMEFLSHQMQRIKVKGTGVRAKSNPDQEPNLWALPFVGANNNNNSSSTDPQTSSCQQPQEDQPLARSVSATSLESQASDQQAPSTATSTAVECEQLNKWGMTFYALDTLLITEDAAVQRPTTAVQESDDNDIDNMDQELSMDASLTDFLGHYMEEESSESLADMLDQVVSYTSV